MRIKDLDGKVPKLHSSRGGWCKYLKTCAVRDKYRGVVYYGASNCNYIVWPDGTMIQNYGFHGKILMRHVRDYGPVFTLRKIRGQHAMNLALMAAGRAALEAQYHAG